MSLYASRAAADAAAERIKIYAQPQRLMILSRLIEGEHTVSEIEAATGIGQPALSQQLAELRRARIVNTRREAKRVYYSLADDTARLCVQSIEAMFGGRADAVSALTSVLVGAGSTRAEPVPKGAAAFARIY